MKVEYLDTPVARIGKVIRRVCDEKNYKYKKVVELCNQSLKKLFPHTAYDPISEDRITKIVEAYQDPAARGAARQIDSQELAAISHALKFSLDEVLGSNYRRFAMIWDPFADPEYSEKVLKLLQKHGMGAKELVGWAEFLPCSMETPNFMQLHHARLFRSQLAVSSREWRQAMDHYNDIGDQRRLLVLRENRTWKMKQLMLVSDLMRIVNGVDEFDFDRAVRRAELLYLADLIADPNNRMELILAEDSDVRPIERKLRDYDSQFTIDDRLTVWRNHGGRISSSEDPGYIAQHRATLDRFVELATYKDQGAVYDQLMAAAQEVK